MKEKIVEILYKHSESLSDIFNDGLVVIQEEVYQHGDFQNQFKQIANEIMEEFKKMDV